MQTFRRYLNLILKFLMSPLVAVAYCGTKMGNDGTSNKMEHSVWNFGIIHT